MLYLQAETQYTDMSTKSYDVQEESTMTVAEPAVAYGIRHHQEVGGFAGNEKAACQSGRMSVVEYFDIVWNSYLKKYEAAQG